MAHTSPDSNQLHDLALILKLEKGHEDGHLPWLEALERRNCKTLKGLLKENHDLVRITSNEGRIVLHVAVIQGCLDLVEDILTLYGKCSLPEIFKARYQVLLTAKDGRCGGVTALGMAQEFLGMEKIIQCLQSGPSNNQQPTLNAQDDESLTTVRDIIKVLLDEPEFEFLKASFGEDVDYNFHDIENNFELVFHHAFSKIGMEESQEKSKSMKFVLEVMEQCLAHVEGGVKTLTFLFNLPNAQGRPPFHALLASSKYGYARPVYPKVNKLIDWLSEELNPHALESCVTAPDTMGRTIFHRNVSMKPDEIIQHYVFDHVKVALFPNLQVLLNQRMKSSQEHGSPNDGMKGQGGATALHLAILHNQPSNVDKLLQDTYDVDLNAILYRRIQYGHDGDGKGARWSPLQLAALLGNPHIVKSLLDKIEKIYDVGKWKNCKLAAKPKFYDEKMPAIHLAAASGNYEVLRLFMDHSLFNHMKAIDLMNSKGARGNGFRTTLHLAADKTIPFYKGSGVDFENCRIFKTIGTAVSLVDIDNHHMLHVNPIFQDDDTESSKTIKKTVYNGKKRCMTMLLELGLDIWQKDEKGDLPEPRWEAPDGDTHWWHDRIRMEVTEAKRNLNAAGNAISVVAGLVATASYAGPLQPPLGFETLDSATVVQVRNNAAVRVFVVSNGFSFFFAILALMLSLMPSLPLSQESLFDEWRHSRGTVSTSLMALLFSVLSILVSYAAASCAGMPDYKSMLQSDAFYPTLIGGLMCSGVIVLCFIRVLRLIKPENRRVASMHKASGRLFEYLQ